jgi:predicted DNA-binding ribbon-helix-helix protein
MSTLPIRMPDAMHARLRDLARARGVSINKLIEEMATATVAAHDAEVRFRLMAIRGNLKHALAILDRLDAADTRRGAEAERPFRSQRRKTTKN